MALPIWEKVKNENYIDFTNRCDDFNNFLVKSKLAYKLPSDQWIEVRLLGVEKKGPSACAVVAPFPQYVRESGTVTEFMQYPEEKNMQLNDCPDCLVTVVLIANGGKQTINFIRAKFRFNENWIVHSVDGPSAGFPPCFIEC